jgi:hypothetical protein
VEERIGGELLIANHLDQSLGCANQEHSQEVRSYLLHSFLQMHIVAATLTSHRKRWNYAVLQLFSWAKTAHLTFSSNGTVQDCILSTVGNALSACSAAALYQYLAHLLSFSPIPTHEPEKIDSTKWETISLSPPGPINVVGQWETVIHCWEIVISCYRWAYRALVKCVLSQAQRRFTVCFL